MLGIYYLLSLIWLGVIMAWTIDNDPPKPGERTRGLLRMERDGPETALGEPERAVRLRRANWPRAR